MSVHNSVFSREDTDIIIAPLICIIQNKVKFKCFVFYFKIILNCITYFTFMYGIQLK